MKSSEKREALDDPSAGPQADAVRYGELLSLGGVLAIAAGLRLWRLETNGFGNPYYSAAVRSMQASWSNFFFGSFDPVGFVTVDKPPVAIWIQALSAKWFGYSGFNILLPQALMGVISVGLLYHLVRRSFDSRAALLAALILAVTPIGVAVDRVNLPDTALVLTLLLAAWALLRAVETGRFGPLLLMAVLVGIGFNIKMLAAYVVLPTFYLIYLIGTARSLPIRIRDLTAATLVLVAVSLSWAIAVELTPKERRPYVGGSRNNSALDLALGYNGLGRIFGGSGNMSPGRFPPGPMRKGAPSEPAMPNEPDADVGKSATLPEEEPDDMFPPMPSGGPGGGGFPPFGPGGPPGMGGPPGGGMMFGGMPGLMRFARNPMASQITWLVPLAFLGAIGTTVQIRRTSPVDRRQIALWLWTGWLATHWVVFSFAQGIFHEYYTIIMAPAVAALAGIGAIALWEASRQGGWRTLWLPATLVFTASWEGFLISQSPGWRTVLLPLLAFGVGLGVMGLVAATRLAVWKPTVPWSGLAAGCGITGVLIGPAVWSATPLLAPSNGMMPVAMPAAGPGGGGFTMIGPPPFTMGGDETKQLVKFLEANWHGERIQLIGRDSMSIGPVIMESNLSAVSLGGFMGGDSVVTKDEFIAMVESGQVRFVMVGGGPGGGGRGFGPPGGGGAPGSAGNEEIMALVRKNGKEVDKALWQPRQPQPKEEEEARGPGSPPNPMAFLERMGRSRKLFDCKPELGLIKPSTQ